MFCIYVCALNALGHSKLFFFRPSVSLSNWKIRESDVHSSTATIGIFPRRQDTFTNFIILLRRRPLSGVRWTQRRRRRGTPKILPHQYRGPMRYQKSHIASSYLSSIWTILIGSGTQMPGRLLKGNFSYFTLSNCFYPALDFSAGFWFKTAGAMCPARGWPSKSSPHV